MLSLEQSLSFANPTKDYSSFDTLAKPLVLQKNGKVYLRYKLVRPSIVNKSQWGLSEEEYLERIMTAKGKDVVLRIKDETANEEEQRSEGTFIHPLAYSPNGITKADQIRYQKKSKIGEIEDITIPKKQQDKFDLDFWFRIDNPKYAKALVEKKYDIIPPYTSIYVASPANSDEHPHKRKTWEVLHAAFVDVPAFPHSLSAPKAICQGNGLQECIAHMPASQRKEGCGCIINAMKDVTRHQRVFISSDNKIKHNMSSEESQNQWNDEDSKPSNNNDNGVDSNIAKQRIERRQRRLERMKSRGLLGKRGGIGSGSSTDPNGDGSGEGGSGSGSGSGENDDSLNEPKSKNIVSELRRQLKEKDKALLDGKKLYEGTSKRLAELERKEEMRNVQALIGFYDESAHNSEEDYKKLVEKVMKIRQNQIMTDEEIVQTFRNPKLQEATSSNNKRIRHNPSGAYNSDFPTADRYNKNAKTSNDLDDIPDHMLLNSYFMNGGRDY